MRTSITWLPQNLHNRSIILHQGVSKQGAVLLLPRRMYVALIYNKHVRKIESHQENSITNLPHQLTRPGNGKTHTKPAKFTNATSCCFHLRKQNSSKHLNWGKRLLTRLKLTSRWLLQNPTLRKSHPLVELPQYELLQNYHGANKIYFDLETSSLCKNCEIIQVIAYYNDSNIFSAYVTPSASLHHNIETLTGITYDELMHHNGHSVVHRTIETAFMNMIGWLNKFQPVVLVAHNGKVFDSERLVHAVNH